MCVIVKGFLIFSRHTKFLLTYAVGENICQKKREGLTRSAILEPSAFMRILNVLVQRVSTPLVHRWVRLMANNCTRPARTRAHEHTSTREVIMLVLIGWYVRFYFFYNF